MAAALTVSTADSYKVCAEFSTSGEDAATGEMQTDTSGMIGEVGEADPDKATDIGDITETFEVSLTEGGLNGNRQSDESSASDTDNPAEETNADGTDNGLETGNGLESESTIDAGNNLQAANGSDLNSSQDMSEVPESSGNTPAADVSETVSGPDAPQNTDTPETQDSNSLQVGTTTLNEASVSVSNLSAAGTADETPVYDGNSHEVKVSLNAQTVTIGGTDVAVVTATDSSGETFYISGLADNKVTVTAQNVADTTFDVSLSGTIVYNSELTQVTAPASLKVSTSGVVQKRTVTLRSMNLVKTYDGNPITNGNTPLAEEDGWVEGQGAYYTFTGSRTAVGTDINAFTISSVKEGTDLNNYQINYTYGGISVVERTDAQKYIITIEGIDGIGKYSGKEQTISGYTLEGRSDSEYQINGNGDPAQVLTVTIGDSTFTVTGISATATGKNAGNYPVAITGSPVIRDSEGNDVTNQFKFEFKPGVFTIDKRKVILTSASLKKKYNNKVLEKHEVTVSGDGFVEGEGATYKFTGKQKKVGESYNYFTYELNEGTLAENYDIEKVPGVLSVTKAGDTAVNEEKKDKSDTGAEAQKPSNNSENQENTSDNSGTSSDSNASGSSASKADTTDQTKADASVTEAPQDGTTSAGNENVLGAKRGQDGTVSVGAGKKGDKVLGARRSSTEDDTNMEGHLGIFAAAVLLLAAMTIKRDKRYKK
ncbi:hypothetical protein [Butyrivibrio sp. AE3004]|uniref:hypothetical protein n=1 Tax=Butyrivibrio sp. AE3004 TaxID=1506994 RepID=UPI0018CBFF20|nr:hypothetical protein [Butyrivibrio sp. AE3004]